MKLRLVIFGVGNYFKSQKEKLNEISNIQIIAFVDNNSNLWGEEIDNIKIVSPVSISLLIYDKVLIMSTYVTEIFNQLINLNIEKKKIVVWEQFYAEFVQEKIEIYPSKSNMGDFGEKVLIITTSLNYNGGSLAAVYGARALKNRGKFVTLMAPRGNMTFISETVSSGITVVISPSLPYIYGKVRGIIEKFDIVLVNVFQMIVCAQKISRFCPVLWWIHEPSAMYPSIIMKYPGCTDEKRLENINIFAVSRKAKENFNKYFPGRIKKTLPYGIPDMLSNLSVKKKQCKKIIFSVVGAITRLKSQDIFLRAIMEMKNIRQAEFWIIGAAPDVGYYKEIENIAAKIDSVKLMGEMTRKEVYEAFSEIDVIVCTSQEEMLSIAITEAMMFGKVCIANDQTGNADYIEHGVNGFVIPQNDIRLLAKQMQWIIENFDKLDNLKVQARKTYEKNFSMNVFGLNLEAALLETKKKSKR